MKIKPFELERYFAKYEFTTEFLLSCSDCEALLLQEILDMADTECLHLWNSLKLAYTESSGHPLLKEEICKLHSNVYSNEVNVMIPEEAIFVAMNCILEKGDHVVVTYPGYQSLYEIANSMSCKISRWLPEFSGSWKFDLNRLKSLIKKETKLLVINFPHNPTGTTISLEELLEILELCRKNNILLFSDEMYRFLEYHEEDHLPSACDIYENAISLFGMSKSFSLPGVRIGWLSSKNKTLMNNIACFKDYTSICNSGPSEILSIIALRNKGIIIKRNLGIIQKNLQLLDSFFLTNRKVFTWKPPKAGPIAFPRLDLNIPVSEFCQKLVKEENTMLLPATVYGFEGNYFRIGFARKNLKSGLEKLQNLVDNLSQVTLC